MENSIIMFLTYCELDGTRQKLRQSMPQTIVQWCGTLSNESIPGESPIQELETSHKGAQTRLVKGQEKNRWSRLSKLGGQKAHRMRWVILKCISWPWMCNLSWMASDKIMEWHAIVLGNQTKWDDKTKGCLCRKCSHAEQVLMWPEYPCHWTVFSRVILSHHFQQAPRVLPAATPNVCPKCRHKPLWACPNT